ncbi:hypothetical protein BDV96DRAFT_653481 [Lophiotrema nucula]|uniref:2EXR domain-containing protein n=1 Tax=Lophiotrema nucula TaxID=690887 RepID=A0A6A5YNC4_9PLEO|nr:hypothetical protein BDV96DRAFT_653481 [Lophiotrema nucula]
MWTLVPEAVSTTARNRSASYLFSSHTTLKMFEFQKLPRELRDLIYEYALPRNLTLPRGRRRTLYTYTRPRWLPPLLRASKLLYKEGGRVLLQKKSIFAPTITALDDFVVFVNSWEIMAEENGKSSSTLEKSFNSITLCESKHFYPGFTRC